MTEPLFNRVAIIGLGLIGGSVAAGIRQQGLAREITGFDVNNLSLHMGRDLGIIDVAANSVAEASDQADLVLLSVPVMAMEATFAELQPDRQVITDVGSVKGVVLTAAERVYGRLPESLVPGHPIAGSEKHGVIAANPGLFTRHRVILTPHDKSDDAAVSAVSDLWQALGAEVVTMSADHHDDILSQTSHLPHLLAYALVDALAGGDDSLEVFEYAAGGFRDFSRIAASDPAMWADIFDANSGPLVNVLDRYITQLQSLRGMIETGDRDGMKTVFTRAKAARDHFSSIYQTSGSRGDHGGND